MAALDAAWIGDQYIGRRLPGLLRDAGLADVGVNAHAHVWLPGDLYQKLLLHFAGLYRERILTMGALSTAELDRCVRELDTHLDHPDTFTLYNTLFQAWSRKPG